MRAAHAGLKGRKLARSTQRPPSVRGVAKVRVHSVLWTAMPARRVRTRERASGVKTAIAAELRLLQYAGGGEEPDLPPKEAPSIFQ